MKIRRMRYGLVAAATAVGFSVVLPPLSGIVAAASSSLTPANPDGTANDPAKRDAGRIAASGWWAGRLAFAGSSTLGLGVLLTTVAADRPRRRVVMEGPVATAPRPAAGSAPPLRSGVEPAPKAKASAAPPAGMPDADDAGTPPCIPFAEFLRFLQKLAWRDALPPRLDDPRVAAGRSPEELAELLAALRFFGLVDHRRRPTGKLIKLVANLSPAGVRALLEEAYPVGPTIPDPDTGSPLAPLPPR